MRYISDEPVSVSVAVETPRSRERGGSHPTTACSKIIDARLQILAEDQADAFGHLGHLRHYDKYVSRNGGGLPTLDIQKVDLTCHRHLACSIPTYLVIVGPLPRYAELSMRRP